MNDSSGPFFDINHSPFCPATGKLARFCKGGAPTAQAAAPATAAETPNLVGQSKDDDFAKDQERRKRNQTVIGAGAESSFGQKLKLGQ